MRHGFLPFVCKKNGGTKIKWKLAHQTHYSTFEHELFFDLFIHILHLSHFALADQSKTIKNENCSGRVYMQHWWGSSPDVPSSIFVRIAHPTLLSPHYETLGKFHIIYGYFCFVGSVLFVGYIFFMFYSSMHRHWIKQCFSILCDMGGKRTGALLPVIVHSHEWMFHFNQNHENISKYSTLLNKTTTLTTTIHQRK